MTDKSKTWELRRRWCQNYDSASKLHQVKLISFDWTWNSTEIFWRFQGARRIVCSLHEEWKRSACDVRCYEVDNSIKHEFKRSAAAAAAVWLLCNFTGASISVQSFVCQINQFGRSRKCYTSRQVYLLFYLYCRIAVDLHNKRDEKFLFLFLFIDFAATFIQTVNR